MRGLSTPVTDREYDNKLVGVDKEHESQQHGSGYKVKMFDRKKLLISRTTKHWIDLTVICDKGLDKRLKSDCHWMHNIKREEMGQMTRHGSLNMNVTQMSGHGHDTDVGTRGRETRVQQTALKIQGRSRGQRLSHSKVTRSSVVLRTKIQPTAYNSPLP